MLPAMLPLVPPPPTCRVPEDTLVIPEYVLFPVSTNVPEPDWVKEPEPETTPAKVMESERLKASAALFVTLPAMLPVVPPLPTCRTPAEMVVPPVYVLLPVRMSLPVPLLVTVPVPEMTLVWV